MTKKKSFVSLIMILLGILLGILIPVGIGTLVSCNKQLVDTSSTYSFDTAVMYVGGEWITVEVDSWKDYDNGFDVIQIKAKDGNTYLVHSMNVTLIKSK